MKRNFFNYFLVFFLLFVFTFPSILRAQLTLPGQEEAKELKERVATSTKTYFTSFGAFFQQKIVPFFLNLGTKIENWWFQKGKPSLVNLWQKINFLLNKEIVIE